MNDKYGKDIDYRIDVSLLANCGECSKYHYVVMAYFQPKDDGKNGFWYNSGISGACETPSLAFDEGLRRWSVRNASK